MSAAVSPVHELDEQVCDVENARALLEGIRAIELEQGREADAVARVVAIADALLRQHVAALRGLRDRLAARPFPESQS